MKKNENIFISLQIQKDTRIKGLCLSVQFDQNAPNISLEHESINWYPNTEELDFIAEAFELFAGNSPRIQKNEFEEPQEDVMPPEEETMQRRTHRSSEIRIAPLPNDMMLEEAEELEPSRLKEKESEKIFIQADEKKIDEILKRKRSVIKNDYATDSDEKPLIDRMLKQKKKK